MKSTVIRFALLSLIVAAVAIRVHAVSTRDSRIASFDIDLAVKSLIENQGLPLKPNPAKPATILSMAIYFQRPDCAEPSVIFPFSLNFEALPFPCAHRAVAKLYANLSLPRRGMADTKPHPDVYRMAQACRARSDRQHPLSAGQNGGRSR